MLRTRYTLARSVSKDSAQGSAESAQGGVQMIYEWRTYEALPGKLVALYADNRNSSNSSWCCRAWARAIWYGVARVMWGMPMGGRCFLRG